MRNERAAVIFTRSAMGRWEIPLRYFSFLFIIRLLPFNPCLIHHLPARAGGMRLENGRFSAYNAYRKVS